MRLTAYRVQRPPAAGLDEAAADFGPRHFGLGRGDQAGGDIAFDLGKLVAIDLDVMGIVGNRCNGGPAASQRIDQGRGRGERHEGGDDPEQHKCPISEPHAFSNRNASGTGSLGHLVANGLRPDSPRDA